MGGGIPGNFDNEVTKKTSEILKNLDIEKPQTTGFKYLPLKKTRTDRSNVLNGNLDNFKTQTNNSKTQNSQTGSPASVAKLTAKDK
jgi:hypothetical protein